MLCLIRLLAVLVLLNRLVDMVLGKPCPSCGRWVCPGLPGTAATTAARRAGDDSSGSAGALA